MDVCMVKPTIQCKRKREEISDMNTGSWTAQEESNLADYVETHGEGKWSKVSKETGLKRCKKSCRVRGNISPEEEDLIMRLHKLLGNRWSLIAGRLPGRTDIEIKNHWNTSIRRKIMNSKKQCKSENNIQNKNPSDEGSFHLLMRDTDAVYMNPANLMEVGKTVHKQSQNAKNIGTDSDAELTQDGNSGNGNVVVELKLSSDASISSTGGNSRDYIMGCYLEQLLRLLSLALPDYKIGSFTSTKTFGNRPFEGSYNSEFQMMAEKMFHLCWQICERGNDNVLNCASRLVMDMHSIVDSHSILLGNIRY